MKIINLFSKLLYQPEQIDMINRDSDLFDDNTQEKVCGFKMYK